MPIPSKVFGAGYSSTVRNVFKINWSFGLSAEPQYQMWDNSQTFPLVDIAGSTVVKEAFTGTAGNSNKPMYALASTSSLGTISGWLPAVEVAGSANPNRMKGTTNYVTDTTIPGDNADTTFNITAEFPFDAAVPSSSSQNILLQVQYQYTGNAPVLAYSYNDDAATGTESSPVWEPFVPGVNGMRPVNTGTVAGNYKFTLPAASVSYVEEVWVTT